MSRRNRKRKPPELPPAAPALVEAVERAAEQTLSKQPRFTSPQNFFTSMMTWIKSAEFHDPLYASDSRLRDTWLGRIWRGEPHIAGIMYSASSINKNRGWELVGGRNQVRRYADILHSIRVAPDVMGWRNGIDVGSQSFYSHDLGWVCEKGRDGEDGPLRALYHTDSSRCKLTGSFDEPLIYFPHGKKPQRWRQQDYFRIASMPSGEENFHGLGYCALSRGIELVKLLIAVYEHDQEQLGARAPKGLLLLRNITEKQWNDAMSAREEKLNAKERAYYGGVSVLASMGSEEIDAKLVALSQLPAGFNIETFTSLSMFGLALCFGYDPSEFWPVQFGALGRGKESEQMSKKATGKGGSDFILALQEELLAELPDTLDLQFDQRDDEGDRVLAQIDQLKANVVKTLAEVKGAEGVPALSNERLLQLMADRDLIPSEWTIEEEEVTATDTENVERENELVLARERVQRAISFFAGEPIVRYRWPSNRVDVVYHPQIESKTRRFYSGVALVN